MKKIFLLILSISAFSTFADENVKKAQCTIGVYANHQWKEEVTEVSIDLKKDNRFEDNRYSALVRPKIKGVPYYLKLDMHMTYDQVGHFEFGPSKLSYAIWATLYKNTSEGPIAKGYGDKILKLDEQGVKDYKESGELYTEFSISDAESYTGDENPQFKKPEVERINIYCRISGDQI